MRVKILTYEIFHGKKPWQCARKFEGNYLLTDSNPTRAQYETALKPLFLKYGDQEILFSDFVGKVNSGLKTDLRAICVTDKSVYKLHPEKYTVKPFEVPIAQIKEIVLSPVEDTFVFILSNEPYRDFVLDLGYAGVERVSELVVTMFKQFHKLKGTNLPVRFSQTVDFNNARTPKKPVGQVVSCNFAKNPNPKEIGCILKPAKAHSATVFYSSLPRVQSPTVRKPGQQ